MNKYNKDRVRLCYTKDRPASLILSFQRFMNKIQIPHTNTIRSVPTNRSAA